jgi:phage gp29-like protein
MARSPKTTSSSKMAPPDTNEIATTGDGRDITRPFVTDLEQPRDPRLLASQDWGVYDKILMDDQVKSCIEQRIRAVVSAEWDVLPGDEKDPRSVEAAEALKDMLGKIKWDRVSEKMLYAPFHGIAIAELIWYLSEDAKRWDFRLKVRHARRFRYDKDGQLRLITRATPRGELVDQAKFWVLTSGATNDDEPYGHGLADWLYWPTLFKRNGIRFWNIFLDKFGTPTVKATYRRGTPKEDIKKLVQALRAVATDSGVAIPEGTTIELLQAAKSGTGDFEKIARYMDEAISKVILSQTMTTQDGSSLSQAQVHAGVKLEVVKADADLKSDSFNAGPVRIWTDHNYGADVAAPVVVRLVEEEADLKLLAETDEVQKRNGWVRSKESFRDTYGDGYERSSEPVKDQPPVDPRVPKPNPKADVPPDPKAASFAATDPRPLYVYRRLKNAKALIAWAKKVGFGSTLAASDMHVTIAYSRRPINWFSINGIWGSSDVTVPAGGARAVDWIGDKGAIALHFASGDLEWRNKEIRDAGASWDFPNYTPHVTITYRGEPFDLETIEAYQGELIFGPEIFETIDNDWDVQLTEVSFAEPDPSPADIVDEAVTSLLEDNGYRPLTTAMQAVITALEASNTKDDFDMALLAALPDGDRETMVQVLARAGFAVRIAAEAGAD